MIFRVIRWSSYIGAAVTLVMVLHKAPPPQIETSPQAAARVEQREQLPSALKQAFASTAPMLIDVRIAARRAKG